MNHVAWCVVGAAGLLLLANLADDRDRPVVAIALAVGALLFVWRLGHAVDTAQRMPGLPDVPTLAELGIPLTFAFWQGVLAPAKTPETIVNYLNKEMNATLMEPQVRQELLKVGLVPGNPGVNGFGGSPEDVRKFLDSEYTRWGKTIQDAKIKVE